MASARVISRPRRANALVVAAITAGGIALQRRGRAGAAIVLLALAAVPTIAAFGFLLYLDSHPIDWR